MFYKAVMYFTLLGMVLSASAHGAARPCSLGDLQCGKDAATAALISAMARRTHNPNWGAVITCRGYVGFTRFRCTWRNGLGKGAALVTLGKDPAWKPKITVVG